MLQVVQQGPLYSSRLTKGKNMRTNDFSFEIQKSVSLEEEDKRER